MDHILPSLFLGHGNPMNAIRDTSYSRAWQSIGARIPRPRAVLAVSAHWYVAASAVTVSTAPRTLHDFGGFPDELYRVRYPAPGDPDLARRVRELLAPVDVALDGDWGLDHGTWSVLRHLYPAADVPVVQLSIDASQPPAFHFAVGQALAALRAEGVLIVGSGNVVHNLREYDWSGQGAKPQAWAARFEQEARSLIVADDPAPLIDYSRLGPDALRSVPTPEHYLPLLYVLGSRRPEDHVSFPVEGIEGGTVSMLAVELGGRLQDLDQRYSSGE
ncbi:MAG: 4,5-DOPA dioxygenase extradiol [Lysobacterales bacterium]